MCSTTTRKTRPVYPAAQSVARWVSVSSCTFRCGAVALLEINGQTYTVSAHKDADGRILGYRLEKGDKSYDVCLDGPYPSCECPDFLYRSRQCKHIGGLRAALAELTPVA